MRVVKQRYLTRTGVQRIGNEQSGLFKFLVVNWKQVTVWFYCNFPNNKEMIVQGRIFS